MKVEAGITGSSSREKAVAQLLHLLQLLPETLLGCRKMSCRLVQRLVRLFFHPALLLDRCGTVQEQAWCHRATAPIVIGPLYP